MIPIFVIWNIVTYKSSDWQEIKIIMICAHIQLQTKTTKDMITAGHYSKSGRPVRPYSTSGTLCLLFVQQTCQNIARPIGISSISLDLDPAVLEEGLAGGGESRQLDEKGNLYIILLTRPLSPGRCPTHGKIIKVTPTWLWTLFVFSFCSIGLC